jgi:hypothetical protein
MRGILSLDHDLELFVVTQLHRCALKERRTKDVVAADRIDRVEA